MATPWITGPLTADEFPEYQDTPPLAGPRRAPWITGPLTDTNTPQMAQPQQVPQGGPHPDDQNFEFGPGYNRRIQMDPMQVTGQVDPKMERFSRLLEARRRQRMRQQLLQPTLNQFNEGLAILDE